MGIRRKVAGGKRSPAARAGLPTTLVGGLIIAAIACSPALAGTVGIDDRHGFDNDGKLATGQDFDSFRATIVGLGHTIVSKASFEAGDLVGLDCLILNQPYQINDGSGYSESEIAAIHAFAGGGGGLVICGEGGSGSDPMVANLNLLAAPYGVVYDSSPREGDGHTIDALVAHRVTEGVSAFGVDYQRRLVIITAPAVDLTVNSGPDDALAVVNGTGGTGNVVLLSDTGGWSDAGAGSERPITFGENRLLLENIVQFVVPEPGTILLLSLGVPALIRQRRKSRRSGLESITVLDCPYRKTRQMKVETDAKDERKGE
jgi:hypothetical protein